MAADILILASILCLLWFCFTIHRRLNRLKELETGPGAVLATLSSQVEEMTQSMERTRAKNTLDVARMEELISRGERVSKEIAIQVSFANRDHVDRRKA